MKEVCALKFEVIYSAANWPVVAVHSQYRSEASIDVGLREHLERCAECRATIAKDLRDFADQVEGMRPPLPGKAPA